MPETNETQQVASEKAWMYSQVETAYVPVSPAMPSACAGCRWFNSYGSEYSQHPDCRIVNSYPDPIEPTGWCNKFEAMPAPAEIPQTPMPVVIVDADVTEVVVGEAALGGKADEAPADGDEDTTEVEAVDVEETPAEEATVDVPSTIKRVVLNIGATVEKAFRRKPDEAATGLKVVDNNWLAVWSNNFKDRDGEMFPETAIDDYVARVDMGVVAQPELWVWHAGKSVRIGQADWVGRHGHFLFAAGTFDADEKAQTAKAYYAKNAHKTTISHGFTYPAEQFDGKCYRSFNTFEISLLPSGVEANLYTSLAGVKAMALSDEKKKYMEEVFGKERAGQILADWDKRGKALEELNVEFKDFVAPEGSESVEAKALERAEKSLRDLIPELAEGSAEAVTAALEAVKVAKSSDAKVKTLEGEIDKLRAEMRLRPRAASQSPETVLSEASEISKSIKEKFEQQMVERDPFTGLEVVKAP